MRRHSLPRWNPESIGVSQIPGGSSTLTDRLCERDWYVSCRFRDEMLHSTCNRDPGRSVAGSSSREAQKRCETPNRSSEIRRCGRPSGTLRRLLHRPERATTHHTAAPPSELQCRARGADKFARRATAAMDRLRGPSHQDERLRCIEVDRF